MTDRIGYQIGKSQRNNVISYLEDHLSRQPERLALRWVRAESMKEWTGKISDALEHSEISYGDFSKRIASFAAGLKNLGIGKGQRVIIFLPMGVDMYTAMFAVQRIGAIAVFLDSWARANHLGASAECVDPIAMISHPAAFTLVEEIPEFSKMRYRIVWGSPEPLKEDDILFHSLLKEGQETEIEAVESEDTALITFTTGSSGTPKGANRTHRFLSAQHEALDKVIPYVEKDLDLPAFPIFSLNNLAAGVSTLLPGLNLAQPSNRDPAILASQILHEKVTCATLSPSMLVGLSHYCAQEQIRLEGLRRVVTGGAPISKDNVRDFYAVAPQSELWILYGSTEVEPMAHIEGREMLKDDLEYDADLTEEGVNVGEISEDLDYKFIKIQKGIVELGDDGFSPLEVAPGEVGEFIVTGDHVCQDYYNNPGAFKKAKIRGPDGRVWHRTGDLAYIDAKRQLWIVGRIHSTILRDGKFYFPVKPEVLLRRMPGVRQAAFLGLEDSRLGERTVAVLQVDEGVNAEELKAEVERVFAKNQIPVDEFYIAEKIPMDPRHHSKVEYTLLRENLRNGKAKQMF